ncbi:uncharacterized protein LOC118789595 isoform X2 [Megalops cyprinoides]|uniref:uncharacterized protein LOC118789595 isoform X2 n=1 Tax=Megalops cyprinoides TaxID=118141 RepID=UPI001863D700|nr:uncharacterized protein LOC118789595 isoform X2 [Megalops cyprinoides]
MTQIITLDELLLSTLQDLEQKDFKLFKWHLCQDVLLEFIPFRKACLEDTEREDTVTKMMERYLRDGAITVTIAILRKMNQNDLAEKLEEAKNKLPPSPVREKIVVTTDRVIAKHNLRLMKRVKVVDRIAKILLSKGFIQNEMYSKICSASTSMEKIWYLMKALNAGGSSAKSAFIDTLNEMEPSLLEDQDEGGQANRLSEMSLVLLGKRGAGKSSAGNTILGREEFHITGETVQCMTSQAEVDGRKVTVVDTPGWKGNSVKDYMKRIVPGIEKSVSELPPGPKAHLVVVQVDLTTDISRSKMEKHLAYLSENDWETAMVLFTHGDQLTNITIEQHIEKDKELQMLVERCGNRYHVLKNNDREDRIQVTQLLEKLDQMLMESFSDYLNQMILQDGDIESSHEKEESEAQQEEKQGGKKSPIFKFWEKGNTKQEELAEQVENTPKEETDTDQNGETEVDPLTLSNNKSGLLSFGIGKFNKHSTPKTVPQVSEEEDKKDMPKDVQIKGEKEEASRADTKAKVSKSSHQKEVMEDKEEEKQGGKKTATLKFWEKSNTKQEELAEQVENTPKKDTGTDRKGETEVAPLTESKQSNSKSGLLSFGTGKFKKHSTPKTVPQVSEEEDKKDVPKDVQTKGKKEEASRADNKAKVSKRQRAPVEACSNDRDKASCWTREFCCLIQ